MIGSVLSLNVVWTFADRTIALMGLPILVSLIFLSGVIVNETKKYLWNDNLDEEGE